MRYALASAFLAALLAAALGPHPAAAATWDEQNRAMGYLILHLSNINVVNGLNLSREQAVALRDLARQVAAASPPVSDMSGAFRPDLGLVRDTYLEVRRRLLAGQEIDEALRQRVAEARAVESAVVRLSITEVDSAQGGCARCHQAPQVADVRTAAGEPYRSQVRQVPEAPAQRRAVFLAHQEGVLGQRGMVTVGLVASRVDPILNDAQKEGLARFSCCLMPPKDMSDPNRIGQAESGEVQVDILRRVRKVPDSIWPTVLRRMLARAEEMAVVIAPGADEGRKSDVREKVRDIYERTRALGEVDFELDRHQLAAELGRAIKPQNQTNDRHRRYMNAFFLTVPGAVEAYDCLIRRLDAEQTASRARK